LAHVMTTATETIDQEYQALPPEVQLAIRARVARLQPACRSSRWTRPESARVKEPEGLPSQGMSNGTWRYALLDTTSLPAVWHEGGEAETWSAPGGHPSNPEVKQKLLTGQGLTAGSWSRSRSPSPASGRRECSSRPLDFGRLPAGGTRSPDCRTVRVEADPDAAQPVDRDRGVYQMTPRSSRITMTTMARIPR
jgi:hypothetical protein